MEIPTWLSAPALPATGKEQTNKGKTEVRVTPAPAWASALERFQTSSAPRSPGAYQQYLRPLAQALFQPEEGHLEAVKPLDLSGFQSQ